MNQSIVFLTAPDLDVVREFYPRLGFALALDQGSCVIFRFSETGFVGFCEGEVLGPATITLVTDEVDEVFAQWSELGIESDGPPRLNKRFQIYHFYAKEPNGYKLEVQRFTDPRWHVKHP